MPESNSGCGGKTNDFVGHRGEVGPGLSIARDPCGVGSPVENFNAAAGSIYVQVGAAAIYSSAYRVVIERAPSSYGHIHIYATAGSRCV